MCSIKAQGVANTVCIREHFNEDRAEILLSKTDLDLLLYPRMGEKAAFAEKHTLIPTEYRF